ncbi:MAG: hypothetical protein ACHQ1G_08320 [Planctomycetota bacterium]
MTAQIEGKKDDDLLARKTGRSLFPTILILDGDGEPLLRLDRASLSAVLGNGRLSAASFARKLDSCERYVALRARVNEGDASAKLCLAVRALEIGKIDVAEFGRAIAGAELTPERAKRIAQVRANAICESVVGKARSSGMDPEVEKEATRECVKLYEAGTHPDSDSADMYWWLVATHAMAKGDAPMIERSIQGLESNGGREQFGPLLAELDAKLKALR